jgi:hypothetical protein
VFDGFSQAGERLLDLYVNYETQPRAKFHWRETDPMIEGFHNVFNAGFHAERLPEPICSNITFCYPGAIPDARVDGVGIEFFPGNGDPWFATFARGNISPNSANFAGAHPNGTHAIVVSKGEGYIVNVSDPIDWKEIPILPIMGVLADELAGVVILWDFVRMICLDKTGIRWKTPRISWDGIKGVSLDEGRVQATIWDAPTSKYVTAYVAIANGELLGGASSPELMGL